MSDRKIIDIEEVINLSRTLGDEFIVIRNPDYIHPDFEICPMAAKVLSINGNIPAFVMDMDGTTTTTEELCIHSLEYMIRLMSGKMTGSEWNGLDPLTDYPHIIGNSTTKHVEYLIQKYQALFVKENIASSFIQSALWTLLYGSDAQRKDEVKNNLINLNLGGILSDPLFEDLQINSSQTGIAPDTLNTFVSGFGTALTDISPDSLVRIGIDIYYQRYHEILELIKNGAGSEVSAEIFSEPGKHMIEPMPGVLTFLSLIKGWLGKDIVYFIPRLLEDYRIRTNSDFTMFSIDEIKQRLMYLAGKYEANPAKTAIVTSSIFYEADIVMNELTKILSAQIETIDMPAEKRKFLLDKFSCYKNIYNSFVTASDSSEIRLKPHRDLYSIALNKLNIPKNEFNRVAGFEDSESGVIAIRAAGIGLCVAVPFAQTNGHNLQAAAHLCQGGLPEAILKHNLFFK